MSEQQPEVYGETWDGVPITPGLVVFTNEMRAGVVVPGSHREHNPGWFDVEYRNGGKVMQDASRVATHFNLRDALVTYREGHDWTFPGGKRRCALCGATETQPNRHANDGGVCTEAQRMHRQAVTDAAQGRS